MIRMILIWYSGNKESANVWTADVSISSHKRQGRIMFMYMELLMDSR